MRCDELELRLYDEDCRAALFDGQLTPADVAMHLASCERCRASWAAALDEAQGFRTALSAPLPADLRAALYRIPLRTRPSAGMARLRGTANAVSAGAMVTIATAFVFSAAPPWQIATFAIAVIAASAIDRARNAGLHLEIRRLVVGAWAMPRALSGRPILASRRGW